MNSIPAALPRARTPDPRSALSALGHLMALDGSRTSSSPAIQKHSSQRIVAVGSRSIESATGSLGDSASNKRTAATRNSRPTQASTSCTSRPPTTRICPMHC